MSAAKQARNSARYLKAIFWLSYGRESLINTEPRKGQPQTHQCLKPNGFDAEFLMQGGTLAVSILRPDPAGASAISAVLCKGKHSQVIKR